MSRRFSKEELYVLRNLIPIDALIETILGIPTENKQGIFRFRCPLCRRFNTATKQETNLARCFNCQQNFNPIDMVMRCRRTSFVESVLFLRNSQSRYGASGKKNSSSISSHRIKRPLSAGEILKDIAVCHQQGEQAWNSN